MLFTFPSRYSFTIGLVVYLALERGRPRFPPDNSYPVVLRILRDVPHVSSTRLSLSLAPDSTGFDYVWNYHVGVLQPPRRIEGLGCSAFARRYLRNRVAFFSSSYLDVSVYPVPHISLSPSCDGLYDTLSRLTSGWISPFGNRRITG